MPDQPDPKAPGLRCPRCKGTAWRIDETRPASGRMVRVRTCTSCKLRVRTRETIEATEKPPKRRLRPKPDGAPTT